MWRLGVSAICGVRQVVMEGAARVRKCEAYVMLTFPGAPAYQPCRATRLRLVVTVTTLVVADTTTTATVQFSSRFKVVMRGVLGAFFHLLLLLLLFLLLLSGAECYTGGLGGLVQLRPAPHPRFLHPGTPANVSVQLGTTAHLHCKIAGLRDQSVSWYRKVGDEIHLITFGFQTYHNDDRFAMTYQHPHDWRLRVRFVQHRDEGTYQCQVSTHPPMSRTVHMHVVEAAMQILDERGVVLREKFYHTGSTIELRCKVSNVPTATALTLTWYRGHLRLNYDAPRGGVSVKTELRGTTAHSWLRVGNAVIEDSGTYYCNVTNLAATSVNIHVVPGEWRRQ
ncbi:junctional adhesion molecule B-like isoform X2 [Eriocheir sinensis]|uniref:junctional adhesion molecule B-like isoform X2 n=1 Tax=Eriocheir sinensis TaxID=95602 RepID=UPI0021C6D093|nr:junctional adhesion molecule B-like isoform X2 [Eriocheir sinensis]